jgi:hypothetical protein
MARNVIELRPRRSPAFPPERWYEWSLEHDGAEVDVFETSANQGPASHNAWVALRRGPALRVAAIDGVTASSAGDHYCGLDAAAWAAQVTRAALLADDDAPVCLWRANRTLHDPSVTRAGARPQAAAVVGDIRTRWDGDATAHLARASGASAYARFGSRWAELFPTPPLTDAAAQVWDAWRATHRDASARERAAAEERALGAPAAWRTAAIGRFAEPLIECTDVEGFDELILVCGSAHLELEQLDALDDWLEALRRFERATPSGKGNVTVVHWRQADAHRRSHPSRA